MNIYALVVTHNRPNILAQCLRALYAQTFVLPKIIVVDNASEPSTAAVLAGFPELEIVRLEENQGGAGGFAAGMAHAHAQGADWIWVMDDDVEPAPNALATLLAANLHQHPDTVALASVKTNPDGTLQPHHHTWYDVIRFRHQFISLTEGYPVEIGNASFAGLLVRAQAIAQVGLPDPDYFIWFDDTEYTLRLQQIGQLYVVPASRMTHHNRYVPARSIRPFAGYWRNYYSLRNRWLILHKHGPSDWRKWRGYVAGFRLFLRGLGGILLWDHQKWRRIQVLTKALVDGVQNRSGKRIDPKHFS